MAKEKEVPKHEALRVPFTLWFFSKFGNIVRRGKVVIRSLFDNGRNRFQRRREHYVWRPNNICRDGYLSLPRIGGREKEKADMCRSLIRKFVAFIKELRITTDIVVSRMQGDTIL